MDLESSNKLEDQFRDTPQKREFRTWYRKYRTVITELSLVRRLSTLIREEIDKIQNPDHKVINVIARTWIKVLEEEGIRREDIIHGELKGIREEVVEILKILFPNLNRIDRKISIQRTPISQEHNVTVTDNRKLDGYRFFREWYNKHREQVTYREIIRKVIEYLSQDLKELRRRGEIDRRDLDYIVRVWLVTLESLDIDRYRPEIIRLPKGAENDRILIEILGYLFPQLRLRTRDEKKDRRIIQIIPLVIILLLIACLYPACISVNNSRNNTDIMFLLAAMPIGAAIVTCSILLLNVRALKKSN